MKAFMVSAGVLVLVMTGAQAATVSEADAPYNGDFETVFADSDPGNDILNAVEGMTTFTGSIVTPGDQSDGFILSLASGQSITAITIDFDLARDPFNPIAINQNTRFIVEEFDDTPILEDIAITGAGSFSTGAGFSLPGGQLYSLRLVTEVLALNSGDPVTFNVTVTIAEEPTDPVPLPGAALLFGSVLAGAGYRFARRSQRGK